ncbi:hypothetical protein MP228_011152 [Amoeboaphelidium protococcarum]|nr:hypothetical protein MP228_011152 [Amoeboaphelidium protococcarum]
MPTESQQQQQQQAATVLLVTASYDRTIRFWEALSGICSRTVQHPDSQVNRVAISTDKKYVAAAGNPNIRIYEGLTNNGNPIATFEGHTANVTAVQFQSNAKWIVSGGEDGFVKVFDMRIGNAGNNSQQQQSGGKSAAQREYSHDKVGVADVVIHPNQVELISCDHGGAIRVWDLRAGLNSSFNNYNNSVNLSGSFNASGSGGNTSQYAKNACSHELIPEEDAMMKSLSIASDSSLLTAGTHKGNVYMWKLSTQSSMFKTDQQSTHGEQQQQKSASAHTEFLPVCKLKAHNNYMLRSVLSPDVKHLATASADSTIKIWSLQSGENYNPSEYNNSNTGKGEGISLKLEKTLTGHQRWVWDCAFSADSEYLVSAASDHTARLWDLSSGESIRQYQGHHKAAVCVSLNDYSM